MPSPGRHVECPAHRGLGSRWLVRTVDRLQRRFLACLTAFAVLATVAGGVSGMGELALYLTPLFLIAALASLLERSPRLQRGPLALVSA